MTRPRALLLVHGEHSRFPNNGCQMLNDLLTEGAGLDVYVADDYAELTVQRLSSYGIVVNYSGYKSETEPTEFQIRDLLEAVKSGTPYIALHCPAVMFKNQLFYRQPLGQPRLVRDPRELADRIRQSEGDGTSILDDDPITPHRIQMIDRSHPITRNVEDFEIVDQLYQLDGDLSRMHVLAESAGHAVLHTTRWQEGKVHYNGLGHDKRAISTPSFQRLIVQAIEWALAAD